MRVIYVETQLLLLRCKQTLPVTIFPILETFSFSYQCENPKSVRSTVDLMWLIPLFDCRNILRTWMTAVCVRVCVHTLYEEMFAFKQKWIFTSSCLNICDHLLMDCNSELTLKLSFFTVFMSHIWKVFDKSSALWGMEISVGGIKPNNQLWIIIYIFHDIY